MSNASLLIHPKQADWLPAEPASLEHQLRAIGLIGESFTSSGFYAGERFLDHIAFMGCSPSISFDHGAQDKDKAFTHIRLHHFDIPTALISKDTRAPHCPTCKQPVKDWQQQSDSADQSTATGSGILHCSQCNTDTTIDRYDWRRHAGFARVFIEITDVYPKEALPQASTMQSLEQYFDNPWDYFYYYQK